MSDVFTKAKRSEVMSRIRGRGNKETELALAKLLRQFGVTGWRRQQIIRLPTTKRRARTAEALRDAARRVRQSRPTNIGTDFVFRKQRVAVFVDGCFWHGCPKHANMPANNRPFWKKKLTGNKQRDRYVTRQLRRQGWRVVRIWEHELAQGRSQSRVRETRPRRFGRNTEVSRQKVVAKIRKALIGVSDTYHR
jgi:DNA mismatch endonuclease (patch repair protein)